MNKKGIGGFAITSIILFSFLTSGIFMLINIHIENNSACQVIGFESHRYSEGLEYCEDLQGNLYYIKLECKGLINYECSAKSITVGEVRVK